MIGFWQSFWPQWKFFVNDTDIELHMYIINILSKHAKLNLKDGQLFADQSKDSKRKEERKNGTSERQSENRNDQSQSNRIFENKNNVNKIEQSVRSTSGQFEISASNSIRLPQLNSKDTGKEKFFQINSKTTEMDREKFLSLGCDTGDHGDNTEEK